VLHQVKKALPPHRAKQAPTKDNNVGATATAAVAAATAASA
jgi:hypothetical protein